MLTIPETIAMLSAIRAVYPHVEATPDAAEVWRGVLGDVPIAEVRESLRTVLQESPRQPTPADILRALRERRRAQTPVQHYDKPGASQRDPQDQAQVDELLRGLKQRFSRN